MSDVPYQQPGPLPPRPEVPDGIVPGPPVSPAPEPREDRFDSRDLSAFPWWSPFAALLLTFLAASVVLGLAVVFVEAAGTPVDAEDLPPGITIGATLAQGAFLIVAAVLFAGLGGRRPTAWAFGFRPTPFWKAFAWAFGAAMAFYLFSFVWSLALGINENDDLAEKLGAKDSTLNLVAVTMLVAIVAPLTEEFFFRGFCFPALSTRFGWIGGAVATGIIFGAIHAGGTKAVFLVPLMVFGFLLCLLYRFTGSLLPCIALHAVNNALALAVTLKWEPWQGLVAVVLAPCVTLAIAWPLVRRRPPPEPALA